MNQHGKQAGMLVEASGRNDCRLARTCAVTLLALLLWTASSFAATDEARMVGRVTRLKGEVIVVGLQGRILQSGTRVFESDELHTGKNSRVEIRLVDESTITLSEDTIFKIDKFLYHPLAEEKNVALSMLKGAFRMVTGQLGFSPKTQVAVTTPLATIGIRGTDFWGGFFKDDELGVLLIEGKAVTISNAAGEQTIARPGYGVTVTSLRARPAKPIQWKPAKVERALQSVKFD